MDKIHQFYIEFIKNSFAFERLFGKTQVITNPVKKTVKNRGTHSLEVAEISKKIAYTLGLNSLLAEAIGLAHDIGHTPFGHLGERALDAYFGGKFNHARFGRFLVENLEEFNFIPEIIEGIENHSSGYGEMKTLEDNSKEGNIVRFADKIAIVFSDYEDIFEKEKIFAKSDFPECQKLIKFFGRKKETRQKRVIVALIEESKKREKVSFSDSAEALVFQDLKKKMYEVYSTLDEKKQRLDLMNLSHNVINKIMISPYQKYVFGLILFAVLTDKEVFDLASGKIEVKDTCIEHIFPLKKLEKKEQFLMFH